MMSDLIPFGAWEPDRMQVNGDYCAVAQNVQPSDDGWAPFPTITPIGSALPSDCKGAFTAFDQAQSPVYFAGTASRLYRFNLVTQAWQDVSPAGAPYSLPDRDLWSFTQFGNFVIVSAINAGMFKFDLVSGTQFVPVGGSPPLARYVDVVGDFLVAAGVGPGERTIQWSGLNNIDFWTPGQQSSDFQEFPDGGGVRGFSGGEFGVIFQSQKIRRMVFAPGTPEIFQFNIVEESRGCEAPYAIVKAGATTFFYDGTGFYALADGLSRPISDGRVSQWFAKRTIAANRDIMTGASSWSGSQIYFAIASNSSGSGSGSLVLIYDWKRDRWAYLVGDYRVVSRFSPVLSVPDALTGSLDGLTISLDDEAFAGGALTVAFVSSGGRLGYPSTSGTLPATLVSSLKQPARPYRSFINGARVETDFQSVQSSLFSTETPVAVADQVPELPINPRTMDADHIAKVRASNRYHAFRADFAQSVSPWKYAVGFEWSAVRDGMR